MFMATLFETRVSASIGQKKLMPSCRILSCLGADRPLGVYTGVALNTA